MDKGNTTGTARLGDESRLYEGLLYWTFLFGAFLKFLVVFLVKMFDFLFTFNNNS